MKKLTDDQMDYFLKNKEFGADVIEAASNTAVVLTQDWCPQWTAMKRYLADLPESEAAVFFIEYNREPRGNEYMHAKETVFKNDLIPYVRYYKNGRCFADSNFVFRDDFLDFFRNRND
ncbi:MAG: hypothetical protein SOZ27_07555 [Spirochaetia bacterium]|nr:hypothetical protein [Spirochaetia bacterium]